VSLARDLDTVRAEDNANPFVHTLTRQWDHFHSIRSSSIYHGYNHTHMDALCHMFYQGKMYNGFSQEEITAKGAAKDSILNAKTGIMTRGILFDIPLLKGVEYLEPGTPI
jgi:hypothetical protein